MAEKMKQIRKEEQSENKTKTFPLHLFLFSNLTVVSVIVIIKKTRKAAAGGTNLERETTSL